MYDLIMKANNLVDILVIVMLSVLTGHNAFEEMVIFAEERLEIFKKIYKIRKCNPT